MIPHCSRRWPPPPNRPTTAPVTSRQRRNFYQGALTMAEAQEAVVAGAAPAAPTSDFDALITREFRPATDEASSAIQQAVQTLAAQALEQTKLISDDAIETIKSMISALDLKLTEQINKIMHHPEF